MEVNRSSVEAVFTEYLSDFQIAFTSASQGSWGTQIMQQRSCTTSNLRQIWLDQIQKVTEWVGPRSIDPLSLSTYMITPKHWQKSLEIDTNTIEDDTFGAYSATAALAGYQFAMHPNDIATDLLRNGNSTTLTSVITYDGKPFYSTTHPISKSDSTSQSNYFTSTALTRNNAVTVLTNMRNNKSADGRQFGTYVFKRGARLLVPPQLEDQARIICSQSSVLIAVDGSQANTSVAGNNLWGGFFSYTVAPELGVDSTTWYLEDVDFPIRPLQFVVRRGLRWVFKGSPTDDNVFWERKLVMGGDQRDGGGYGMWWTSAKCVA